MIIVCFYASAPTPTTPEITPTLKPTPDYIYLRVIMTGIYDKTTHEPIPNAKITFTRYNPDYTIEIENPSNDFPVNSFVPGDGKTRLYARVTADSYNPFGLIFKKHLIKSKFYEFPVLLEKIK